MKSKLPLGLLIFVGVPLLGWGLTDIPGYFSNGARLGYVALIGIVQAVAVIGFPASVLNSGAGEKLVPRQQWTVRWLQLASVLLMVGGPFCDRRGLAVFDAAAIRYLGLALAVPGFVLMLWARAALGKQFSLQVTIQAGHRLVTDGLYRYVRHPRYSGILLFLTGTALVYRSLAALAVAAVSAAVLLWRIADEEKLLQQEFGAEWDAYAAKTARLIPAIL